LEAEVGQVGVLQGIVGLRVFGDKKALSRIFEVFAVAGEKDEQLSVVGVCFFSVFLDFGLYLRFGGVFYYFRLKVVEFAQVFGDGIGFGDGVFEFVPVLVIGDGEEEGEVFSGAEVLVRGCKPIHREVEQKE
jgi:hypothetical protein